MRILTNQEEEKLKVLTENSISLTLIEPTETGLKKSIMDATGTVRNFLKANNFHDYNLQSQGPENKIIIEAIIYEPDKVNKSNTSLYRPNTKNGDPRIWFSGLTKFANPNDILALIGFENKLHVLNLTQLPLEQLIDSRITNPVKELIEEINYIESAISKELLNMLINLANSGPVLSMVDADTSVGRTLETALGIGINSSKLPDYKGIEIKSFRSNKGSFWIYVL